MERHRRAISCTEGPVQKGESLEVRAPGSPLGRILEKNGMRGQYTAPGHKLKGATDKGKEGGLPTVKYSKEKGGIRKLKGKQRNVGG